MSREIERGSGMAGARTMARDDGSVDVVINGNALGLVDPDGGLVATAAGLPRLNEDAFPFVRHSVVHEAQHVEMEQLGSGFDAYDRDRIAGSARYEMFVCATKFCDEHRAEAAAAHHLQPERPTVEDVLDVLSALGGQLAAAVNAYQQSQSSDIAALKDSMLGACVHYWTALAYWTADHRVEDVVGEIHPDVATLELWQRYVGPTWDSLRGALASLPVGDLTTAVDVLHDAAAVAANALEESLQYIGIRYFDQGDDDWWFSVDRLDFPSERR
jgi:hypothetical protein